METSRVVILTCPADKQMINDDPDAPNISKEDGYIWLICTFNFNAVV